MKKLFFILLLLCPGLKMLAGPAYDLVIVGGTPGGIMAAISAARLGKKSVILERTAYIGGLPANGLVISTAIRQKHSGNNLFPPKIH